MSMSLAAAQAQARSLYARAASEKAIAAKLPLGAVKDRHWMRGERFADQAWSIEEAFDIETVPSGLWR
ncbi:hypothetical protein [Sphingomonas spermidinifaciens]|uniref:hypothetical protein n=1 Tax=Sphingomonas spermidinifaciens TaxID=1141889 RepID=UPI0011421F54|nr:hypothetical protein [Sphingomonas spermidinifaciens]